MSKGSNSRVTDYRRYRANFDAALGGQQETAAMSDFRQHRSVTVRRPRPCFGCRQLLQRGTTAIVCTKNVDGRFSRASFCEPCQMLFNSDPLQYEDGINEGEFIGRHTTKETSVCAT